MDSALRLADEAAHSAFRTFWSTPEGETAPPLVTAVGEARKRHRALLGEHGLAGACPDDPSEARSRLAGYVEAVAGEVQGPLAEAWEEHEPLSQVSERYGAAVEEMSAALSSLPRRHELRTGTEELLEPVPGGVLRRMGRAAARLFLRVRPSSGVRTIDLQAVSRRHVHHHVQPGWADLYHDALRAWGRWSAGVEAAWRDWIEVVLEATTEREAVDVEAAKPEEIWTDVAAAAAELDAALKSAAGATPGSETSAEAVLAVDTWSHELTADTRQAGIPPYSARPEPPPLPRPAPVGAWDGWGRETLDRFALHRSLLTTFNTVKGLERLLPGRLRADAASALERVARTSAEALDALAADAGAAEDLLEALPSLREAAHRVLAEVKAVRPVAPSFEDAARRASDTGVSRLHNVLRGMPVELVIHRLPENPATMRSPGGDPRVVRLQEAGRQSFDSLRVERIRTLPALLVQAAPRVAAALDEVAEVVAYGFESAEAELNGARDEDTKAGRELLSDGLTRAADGLRAANRPVEEVVAEIRAQLGLELTAGCDRLVERALARTVRGRLLDAQSTVERQASHVWRRLGPTLRRAGQIRDRGLAALRKQASRFVRRGRALVGADEGSRDASFKTARALSVADQMMMDLPLVYQRLFSGEPLAEGALLVGRDTLMAETELRWQRWHGDNGVPLIVTGGHGAGTSSFLKVLRERVEKAGGESLYHRLDHRVTDEVAFCALLSKHLRVPAAATLDELAGQILRAPRADVPDLLILDNIEHLYTRVSSGTDLIERFLTLMAETEPRVLWAASINPSAWQLVQRTEPTAVAQVDRLDVAPLSADDLRSLIMTRHRRSGLVLTFQEPQEGRHLLRRRLDRARSVSARAEIVEADFFDRLHRSSHGNLRLALYQWLRSADFTASEGEVTMRPPNSLDFSFLYGLDLNQNFTLKAFLEHRTLTLGEHDAVFRLPRHESFQILESLSNRHIIRAVPGKNDRGVSEIEDTIRYEILPLLVGAVSAHLATQNIVH